MSKTSPGSRSKRAGSRPAPDTARQRIADSIKQFREEDGLSQEQLAESAGFHRTYISQLERQVSNVSIDNLEKVAVALGVDVQELLKPRP